MSGQVSKKDFAAIYGCSKAYISQLIAARRLVLSDDGKRVDVDRSLELLGATSDPSKAGVRERWAAYRADQGQPAGQGAAPVIAAAPAPMAAPSPAAAPAVAPTPAPPPVAEQRPLIDEPAAPAPAAAAPTPARSEYQDARTRREQAEAELAQIELMKARGKVLDADSTLRAVASAHIAVRTELLNLPDRITPLVLGLTDRRRVWELIQAECERLATTMQQSAQQLAQNRVEVSA